MEAIRNKLKKWREEKKLPKIIIVSLLILLGMMGIVGVYAHNNANSRLERQLALGDQYLADMDYERAIAAYEEALRIDDKCVAAYVGIAEAYTQLGDLDMAIEYLEIGIEKTGSEELIAKLEAVRALKAQLEDIPEETEAPEEDDGTDDKSEERISEETEMTESEEIPERPAEEQPKKKKPAQNKPEQITEPSETAEPVVEAVVEPAPYIPQPEPVPAPEPGPAPEPEPEPETPEIPPRGTNISQIGTHFQLRYGPSHSEIELPGARIRAELCDQVDDSIQPVLIGESENGLLTLSAEGDSDYQYIRVSIDLPEGYYFYRIIGAAGDDLNVYYNYDESVGLYSGLTYEIPYLMNESSNPESPAYCTWGNVYYEHKVINPSVDGTLTAQPENITVKVGDIVDLNMIQLTHVKPDGSTESVSATYEEFSSARLWETWEFVGNDMTDLKYHTLMEGVIYVDLCYEQCWVTVPVTIEAN